MKTTFLFAIVAISAASVHAGLLYEPANYAAQDNLVVNFDGIRNAGKTADHDDNAATWVNLGTAGGDFNATFDYEKSGATASGWAADGYNFTAGGKIRLTWNASPIAFMFIVR